MPFGKHKGKQIHLLPKGYLRWMAANLDMNGDLKLAVQWALAGREYNPPAVTDLDDAVHKICRPFDG